MARDTKALTDEVEFFDEPSRDTKMAALKTICAHSTDVSEALEVALMLGVHPSQLKEVDRVDHGPGRFV